MAAPFLLTLFHGPTTFKCSRASYVANKLGPSKLKPSWIACPRRPSFGKFDPFAGRKGVACQSKIVNASAFRSGSDGGIDGDDGITPFEQEAFVSSNHSDASEFMADGLESTLNQLGVWIMVGLFSAFILLRHDAVSLWAATGSIINSMLSVILKWILNQERPFSDLRSDPGMPSSHAQTIFFMVVFAVLSIFKWLGINELSVALGVLLLAMGSYLSWLRVSQQLHTISQVAAGAVLGLAFCGLWCWSWIAFASEAFNSLLWVRILVSLGAVGFAVSVLLFIINACMKDKFSSKVSDHRH